MALVCANRVQTWILSYGDKIWLRIWKPWVRECEGKEWKKTWEEGEEKGLDQGRGEDQEKWAQGLAGDEWADGGSSVGSSYPIALPFQL